MPRCQKVDNMSFSQQVKKEITARDIANPCCITAGCYGIACFGRHFDARGVVLHTERAYIAQWAKQLYEQAGIVGKVYAKGNETARTYEFSVKDPFEVEKLLALLGHTGEEPTLRIHTENFMCAGCLATFAAAAFLCCGTVVNPRKSYNMEFVCARQKLLEDFEALLRGRGFAPKRTLRKGTGVLYFKASEQIEDMLTFMGAGGAALEIMNTKVYRDFRNKANRIANCETANIDKTINANRQVMEDIRLLEERGILHTLPDTLREAARLRRQNPELSLAEIAQMCEAPVSKSGLSHRYRKLSQLAAGYRATQS